MCCHICCFLSLAKTIVITGVLWIFWPCKSGNVFRMNWSKDSHLWKRAVKRSWLTESSLKSALQVCWEKSNVLSPATSSTTPFPDFTTSNSGQVSHHWLHLLHLGCLAFFSSPKWSCKFQVSGRVTNWEMGASKWEIRWDPGTSKLHSGLLSTITVLACQLSP